jgi:hypothetical protein
MNFHPDRPGTLFDFHDHVGGFGVPGNVVEGRLHHAEQGGALGVAELFDPGEGGEAYLEARLARQGFHEGVQRGDQAEVVQQDGPEFAREAVHDLDRLLHDAARGGDFLGEGRRVGRMRLAQVQEPHVDAGEDLADLVVQRAADLAALFLLREDHLAGE